MILFQVIRFKNFLSTGNAFTEIRLDRSPTTLIIGKNGHGKSQLLDALAFVLFGKPFRLINKPTLVNSINQRDCVVEVEFFTGNKQYKIIRGIKPNIFEIYIDGEMVKQDSKSKDYQDYLEKNILKLNFKSFTQIIVLGKASYKPFMQLDAANRRAIIEDLLDIKIFSLMNKVLKTKVDEWKILADKNDNTLILVDEKIKLHRANIDSITKNNEAKRQEYLNKIDDNQKQIDDLNAEIAFLQNIAMEKASEVASMGKDVLQDRVAEYEGLARSFQSIINKRQKDIEFYTNNNSCPTCKQEIAEQIKCEHIKTATDKIAEVTEGYEQAKKMAQQTIEKIANIRQLQEEIDDFNRDISKKRYSIAGIKKFIDTLRSEINNVSAENLDEALSKLDSLKQEKDDVDDERRELSETKRIHDTSSVLLKDSGFKSLIIKKYLPSMNKMINKYLEAMDFFVSFNIDENFGEVIKSRYRDEFSYYSFSEGQKARIDMALLFTWREVAKKKNSVNTNLLILDEVFEQSMDTEGVEDLMKILGSLGSSVNLFVLTPKWDNLIDKFHAVIKFEMTKNFSVMK